MATKLGKKQYPAGTGPNDFECFGPIATKDGEFDDCRMADLGCFKQDGTDSNKYYHGAVVKCKTNGKWYAFFQWGRTGGSGDFQFVEGYDEQDAHYAFVQQIRSKNDKRGEWVDKGGLGRILQAKPNKDCYLVRPLATRDAGSPGLPGARAVTTGDVKVKTKTVKKTAGAKKQPSRIFDRETIELMRAMNVAAVQFTKKNIQGGTIPTQASIDEARTVLIEAQKRLVKVGDNLTAQTSDKDLRDLTYHLYSRVPKVKPVGAPESTWILSQDNIFAWQQDLDAFENALKVATVEIEEEELHTDPLGGMKIDMKHLPVGDTKGDFIRQWMPNASLDRHSWVGSMRIAHVWEVTRHADPKMFEASVDEIIKGRVNTRHRPIKQPRSRPDLEAKDAQRYEQANVGMLFHGTRSVNVPGILREGLRLPRQLVGVVITGAMFGPGIYWADDWKKSAGYTSLSGSYWSGGSGSVRGRKAFMFVADVALGTPHLASGPRGYTAPPRGCHCVFGKAGASGVANNEWIVYKQGQNRLRYLVEFETR